MVNGTELSSLLIRGAQAGLGYGYCGFQTDPLTPLISYSYPREMKASTEVSGAQCCAGAGVGTAGTKTATQTREKETMGILH